jgi:hypothetical protein
MQALVYGRCWVRSDDRRRPFDRSERLCWRISRSKRLIVVILWWHLLPSTLPLIRCRMKLARFMSGTDVNYWRRLDGLLTIARNSDRLVKRPHGWAIRIRAKWPLNLTLLQCGARVKGRAAVAGAVSVLVQLPEQAPDLFAQHRSARLPLLDSTLRTSQPKRWYAQQNQLASPRACKEFFPTCPVFKPPAP